MVQEEHLVKQGLLFQPITWESVQKVVLIGFRGAGKSRFARQLALTIGWRVISTDEQIEVKINAPIEQFVSRHGWTVFRKIETEVIKAASHQQFVIIDSGGGVIEKEENMQYLTQHAAIVWVDAPVEELIRRLRSAGDRPLLSESDWETDVKLHYERRVPLYRKYAQLYVNTTVPQSKALVLEFLSRLREA